MEIFTDSSKIDANEVKKILYKTKVMAKFSHYVSGNLYYTVEVSEGHIYQFPIETVERINSVQMLSSDLGSTSFYNEIKASELNRWIAKAIEANTFIRIS